MPPDLTCSSFTFQKRPTIWFLYLPAYQEHTKGCLLNMPTISSRYSTDVKPRPGTEKSEQVKGEINRSGTDCLCIGRQEYCIYLMRVLEFCIVNAEVLHIYLLLLVILKCQENVTFIKIVITLCN